MKENNTSNLSKPEVPVEGFVVRNGRLLLKGRKNKSIHFTRIHDKKLTEDVFAYIGIFKEENKKDAKNGSNTD